MKLPKNLQHLSPDELAESFVIPETMDADERREASRELAAARKKRRTTMTEDEELYMGLLQLKYQLEDYLESTDFDPELTFSYFLKRYLALLNKKRKEFAAEIAIHETLLSQLVNDHREPNEQIMIRLELHSNNTLPAADWLGLVTKVKEHEIRTSVALRTRERRYVRKTAFKLPRPKQP